MPPAFLFAKASSQRRGFHFLRSAMLLCATGIGTLLSSAHADDFPWTNGDPWHLLKDWIGSPWLSSDSRLLPAPIDTPVTDGVILNAATNQTWLGDGGSGGNGTWGTPADWSPATWMAGNIAIFGGTAGTVTVGSQSASGLTFNVGGYTLSNVTSGTLTLSTGSVITTNGGTTTFASTLNLAGAGGVALTKTGAGTLALSTNNSALGTPASPSVWTVTGGTYSGTTGTFTSVLSIGAGNNLGATPTNATTQLILDAGTLQISGTGLNPAIGANRTIQVNAAGGAITDSTGNPFQGAITDNAGSGSSLYLSNTSGTTNISGIISGTGSLTWNGAGALTMGAKNTYSGGTTINGGVVELTGNTAGGTGSFTVNSGAELTTLGSQITNPVTVNGGKLSWDFYSGSGNYQGPITLNGGGTVSLISFYTTASGGGNAISGSISGNISGNGGLTTTNTSPSGFTSNGGTLTLSGNNTYTGATTIGAGTTVTFGSATALGPASNALSLAGALNLNGYSPTVGALTMTGTTTTGPISTASAGTPGAGTLNYTFGANSVENLTVASASLSGTNDLQFNPASLTTPGTYTLINSTNGTLGGSWEFAGAENLTAAVTSIIVHGSGSAYSSSSYYRLTLGSTAGSETVTVTTDVPNKVVTIFPFGSSITAGQSAQYAYNGGGYRTQLYQDLVDDGRFIPNYVGSSTNLLSDSPNEGNILTSANQLSNEGHPGWTTLQMLANLNMYDGEAAANGGFWLKPGNGENPNYITVNIGGNDAVDYGTSAALMAAASHRLDAIVSEFNILRPGVATVLSSIGYRGDNTANPGIYSTAGLDPYYNPSIPGIVFNHVLAGQNVSFLDLRSIINYTTDVGSDHIHPIQSGYDKMANAWYQSIIYGQAYWTGSQSNVWSTVNGSSTNFAMDAALTTDRGRGLNDPATNTFLIYPDVYFNNNTAALNTTLGADTTIRSLNFTSGATGAVTIGAGNTLTIGSVDTSSDSNTPFTLQNSGGITVQAGTGAHTIAANVALGADQTWGNVSSNDLTVSGGISGAHNLAFVGSYTVYNPGTYTPNASNPQQASFTTTSTTVSGTGGFVLSGSSAYTGTTTISGVKVSVDNAGSTTPRLAGTSGIVLSSGGTLLLTSSSGVSTNRINNNATLTLAGGTFNTGGFSEGTVSGTTPTQGIGALTLTASSTLDLGNGASNVTFANSSAGAWTSGTVLSIYDWTGNTAGGGTDKVFFGNDATGLTGAQLSQVAFYSDAGSTLLGNAQILSDGEIVPVPEPATVLGGILLVGAAFYRGLRRRSTREANLVAHC